MDFKLYWYPKFYKHLSYFSVALNFGDFYRILIGWYKLAFKGGREGILDNKLYWYPKFYKHIPSLAGLKLWGSL